MKHVRIIPLLLCLALLSLLVACSKKAAVTRGGAALVDSQLLSRIPADSVAFGLWNIERPSYQRLKTSPWGSETASALEKLSQKLKQGDAAQEKLAKLMEALKAEGLIPGSADQKLAWKEAVFFAALNQEKKLPEFGLMQAAAAGSDLSSKLPALQAALKAQDLAVKPESFGAQQGFSLSLEGAALSSFPLKTIYVAATPGLLVSASSAELVALLLADKHADGMHRIKASAEFQRLQKALTPSDEEYALWYADLAFLGKNLSLLLPESVKAEDKSKLESFPLAALLASQGMGAAPQSILLVSTNPKDDSQKKWLSAFSTTGQGSSLRSIAGGASFGLALDGGLAASLKNTALAEMPADQQAAMKSQLAVLDSIKSVGISLLPSSANSPLPGLVIKLESSSSAEVLSKVKDQVGGILQGSGMPVSQWQTKDLEGGAKTSYMQSPMFGVGLYLLDTGKAVLVASSEEALKPALAPPPDIAAALEDQLAAGAKRLPSSVNSFARLFIDFVKLAEVVDSVQGTLGAFTGGQSKMDPAMSNELKKMGSMLISLGYGDGIFAVQQGYLPVKN